MPEPGGMLVLENPFEPAAAGFQTVTRHQSPMTDEYAVSQSVNDTGSRRLSSSWAGVRELFTCKLAS